MIIILLALAVLLTPFPCLAYLDPGTGSFLLQMIIGGCAAVTAGLGTIWHYLRGKRSAAVPKQEEDNKAPGKEKNS